MNWQEYMRSKYYVEPTKRRNLLISFLNIALLIVIILSFFEFIMDHDFKALLGIAAPVVIVGKVKGEKESTGYYEMCAVTVTMDENGMSLLYEKVNKKIEFFYKNLQSVEYSDKLGCMRLVGLDNVSNQKIEHLFYLEEGREKEVLEKFTECSGLTVKCVDRESVGDIRDGEAENI